MIGQAFTMGPSAAARMGQGAEHCGQNGIGGRALEQTWEVDTWEVDTWEVDTWEVDTWEDTLGKIPLGKGL